MTATNGLMPARALASGVLRNAIGGEWVTPSGGDLLIDRDPADPRTPLVESPSSSTEDAAAALAAAERARPAWAGRSLIARAAVLLRAATLLRARAPDVAHLLTMEEGKPLIEALGEVERTAETFEALAALAYTPTGDVFAGHRTDQWVMSRRQPLGVAVVIAPWNFPLLIPAWKVGSALLAGNPVVLKPADPSPLVAATLVEILEDAGLPEGVLNVVFGRGATVGPALLRAPATAVSFTGGNDAGAVVARAATEHHLKVQLELGGNNSVLVLADADLDQTVAEIVAGALSSSGQKCTATQRVFVDVAIARELRERLVTALRSVRLGSGLDPIATVGPLVSDKARVEFEQAVAALSAEAARTTRFGETPEHGYFVQPALVEAEGWDRDVFGGEVFGPLLTLFEVEGLDEGIEHCNDTPFGLSASVFTRSVRSALAFADGIEAGMVHVNSQTTGSEPHVPFGGVKRSSNYSRELGRESLDFFTQVQSVYLEGTP
ncbi:MAG: hypothetical protein JWN32_91 [Solirubrobacterales bacterium]|nr:hypothetical protein [Solirubrobacterales bacterium]